MKVLVVVACLGLIAVAYAAPNPNAEMLKPLVMQCQTDEGGSDGDSELMLKAQQPNSPAGLCMMTCVHEKVGIIQGGKISKPTFIEIGKQVVKNDPALVPFVSELADECEPSVNGKSRCEIGSTFGKCLRAGMAKRNIKLDFF